MSRSVRRRALSAACVAGLTAAALPAAADAVPPNSVTRSQVTAPASPFRAVEDADAPATVQVQATTDGTAGDLVDIVCSYQQSSQALLEDAVVGAGGAVDETIALNAFPNRTCILRVVPADLSDAPAYRPFAGTLALVATRSSTLVPAGEGNAGLLYDYDLDVPQPRFQAGLDALGDSAIADAYFLSRSLERADDVSQGFASLPTRTDDGTGSRSSLLVDGHSAYTANAAGELWDDGLGLFSFENAGMPALTVSQAYGADGAFTVTESTDLVRCPTDTVPATAVTCPSFLPTGVRLVRTYRMPADGHRVEVSDAFAAIDGVAHALDLRYEEDNDTSEIGWALPPLFGYDRYGATNAVPAAELPAGPIVIAVKEIDDEPEGGLESSLGAVGIEGVQDELSWSDEDKLEWPITRLVPASGTSVVRQVLAAGLYTADAVAEAGLVADGYAGPQLTLDAPANGASAPTGKVTVSGSASDSIKVAAVTVNGAAVALTGGRFATELRLARGANTITVEVVDGAGLKASAQRTVTFEPTAPVLTARLVKARDAKAPFVFTVVGKLELPSDKTAGEACAVADVSLTVRNGKRKLRDTRVALRADCTFRGSLRMTNRKRFKKARRLSVTAKLLNGAVLSGVPAVKLTARVR